MACNKTLEWEHGWQSSLFSQCSANLLTIRTPKVSIVWKLLETGMLWITMKHHLSKHKINFWCSYCYKPIKNDISFHHLKLRFCLKDKYENCINNFDILYYLSVITYFVSITVPTLMCQKYQLPQFLKTSGKYKE